MAPDTHLKKELEQKFPGLEAELVDEMAEAGEVRTIREDEWLMRSGQNIRSAILLLEGLVKIYREDDEGNEFFMYYLQGGEACAISLVCAIKQETSELKAKAVSDARVLMIPLKYVDEWMSKYKSWAEFALSTYRKRFEEVLHTVDHIAFRHMDERLVFYLGRLKETLKTSMISISITEIARDLNSSREVISRLLKKLADEGVVRLHRSNIEILDLGRIQ